MQEGQPDLRLQCHLFRGSHSDFRRGGGYQRRWLARLDHREFQFKAWAYRGAYLAVLDTPENRQFQRLGFALLGPRNGLEATYVNSFLHLRLQERLFLKVEADVLTRTPVGLSANAESIETGSCRRWQRTGHDHAAFGVVADIEGRANGFGPKSHDFLSHAL